VNREPLRGHIERWPDLERKEPDGRVGGEMLKNNAEIVVDALERTGVRYLFGYPGGQNIRFICTFPRDLLLTGVK